MVVDHRHPVHHQRASWRSSPSCLVVPVLVVMSLWFRKASERGYRRVRDGIANVLADLVREPPRRAHRRPPTTASATTSSTTATWWATTATPTYYTARINAVYGPGTQLRRASLGQAVLLAIGGDMVLHHQLIHRRAGGLLPLPEPVLPADPAARPAVQHVPAGPGVGRQAARPCSRPTRPCIEHRTRCELPPIDGEIVFDDVVVRLRPGGARSSATSTCGSPRARRSPSSARPAPASRRMAKLVTRFYDPTERTGAHRRHDLRDVTMRLAAPPARRRPPGAVPLRRDDPRQHRLRPPGRDRRRGRTRRSTWSGSPTWSSGCPTASTPWSTSAASRCRRASAS